MSVKKLKERTIMSVVFDMDTQPNHMYQPTVLVRYDSDSAERPIHAIVSYGWNKPERYYPFNERMKKWLKDSPSKVAMYFLDSLLPAYDGAKKISELYQSEFGRNVAFAMNHEKVLEHLFKEA